MPISVFDAAVVGGDTDPNVSDATPGCLLSFTSGAASNTVIDGPVAARRPAIRIPPSYVAGGVTAYWARVKLSGGLEIHTSLDNAGGGSSAGPDLTDDAESNIGVAIRAADGSTISFLLSVLNDPTEPYRRNLDNLSGTSLAFDTAPISTFTADEFRACEDGLNAASGGQVVIGRHVRPQRRLG